MVAAQMAPPVPLANKKIAAPTAADAKSEPTIGLGAFCAFWGGPGFGTMVGGAIWTSRDESQEAGLA